MEEAKRDADQIRTYCYKNDSREAHQLLSNDVIQAHRNTISILLSICSDAASYILRDLIQVSDSIISLYDTCSSKWQEYELSEPVDVNITPGSLDLIHIKSPKDPLWKACDAYSEFF